MGGACLRDHGHPGPARGPGGFAPGGGQQDGRAGEPYPAGAQRHPELRAVGNRHPLGVSLSQPQSYGKCDADHIAIGVRLCFGGGGHECVCDTLSQPESVFIGEPEQLGLAERQPASVALAFGRVPQHDRAIPRHDLRSSQLELGHHPGVVE